MARAGRGLLTALAGAVALGLGVTWLVGAHWGSSPRTNSAASLDLLISSACPASIQLPSWIHNPGVVKTAFPSLYGGIGYIGADLHEEALFMPQSQWSLAIGGLSVVDVGQDQSVLASWHHLAYAGRIKLWPSKHHWDLAASWRIASRCLSVNTPLPSLAAATEVLHVVALSPHLHGGSWAACQLTLTANGHLTTVCRITRSAL